MGFERRRRTKRGETRWVALYADPTGRQRSAGTFTTKAAAKRAWQEQEAAIRRQAWIAPEVSGQTFDRYVDSMFWPHRVPRLAATSLADDERLLRLHLRPYFGSRQMDAIRHSVVQAWVTERLRAGVRPARIREAHTLLHTILNGAIKDGVLSGENPVRVQAHLLPQVQGDLSLRVRRVSS